MKKPLLLDITLLATTLLTIPVSDLLHYALTIATIGKYAIDIFRYITSRKKRKEKDEEQNA